MNSIGAVGMSHYQQMVHHSSNVQSAASVQRQSKASEEASESPAEKAAELRAPSTHTFDTLA